MPFDLIEPAQQQEKLSLLITMTHCGPHYENALVVGGVWNGLYTP